MKYSFSFLILFTIYNFNYVYGQAPFSQFEIDLICAVNRERIKAKVKPVDLNAALTVAGLKHSMDMYRNNFFNHTGSDGSLPWDRVGATVKWFGIGENLGTGQTQIPQIVRDWMNSEKHKENLLLDQWTHMGIGRIGNYWSQVFGNLDPSITYNPQSFNCPGIILPPLNITTNGTNTQIGDSPATKFLVVKVDGNNNESINQKLKESESYKVDTVIKKNDKLKMYQETISLLFIESANPFDDMMKGLLKSKDDDQLKQKIELLNDVLNRRERSSELRKMVAENYKTDEKTLGDLFTRLSKLEGNMLQLIISVVSV